MDIVTLTAFFMWCSAINIGLFALSLFFLKVAPDLVYRLQSAFLPLSRDAFDKTLYGFMGLFKLFILVFNLVPYLALRIMG